MNGNQIDAAGRVLQYSLFGRLGALLSSSKPTEYGFGPDKSILAGVA
jgi:hypothetical protein